MKKAPTSEDITNTSTPNEEDLFSQVCLTAPKL